LFSGWLGLRPNEIKSECQDISTKFNLFCSNCILSLIFPAKPKATRTAEWGGENDFLEKETTKSKCSSGVWGIP